VLALSGPLAPWLAREEADAHNALTACKKKSGKKKCIKKAKKHNAQHASETVLGGTCTPSCAATKPCDPKWLHWLLRELRGAGDVSERPVLRPELRGNRCVWPGWV
jgi:hypothetical protein